VLLMWRMTSFMVALLLAFRVNRVYLRWCAALQAFGGIGTAAVTLAQQAVLWVHDPLLQVRPVCPMARKPASLCIPGLAV
jgi:predicted membrane chloride channel (bestrophin family)